MYLAQFVAVGLSGAIVNLAVLTGLHLLGAPEKISLAGGIAVSVITNFLLNRRFTFSYARGGNVWRQFAAFVGTASIGMVVNYAIALYLRANVLVGGFASLQLAALAGIIGGTFFNFVGNRYVVFRKRYIKS
jgi:dolichol-phosphate mannosyltransferase